MITAEVFPVNKRIKVLKIKFTRPTKKKVSFSVTKFEVRRLFYEIINYFFFIFFLKTFLYEL